MTGAPGPGRVLIADDQRVVRDGLDMLVALIDGVEVVGTACGGPAPAAAGHPGPGTDHLRGRGCDRARAAGGSPGLGVQIADELQQSGRHVFLSVGPHDRPPRVTVGERPGRAGLIGEPGDRVRASRGPRRGRRRGTRPPGRGPRPAGPGRRGRRRRAAGPAAAPRPGTAQTGHRPAGAVPPSPLPGSPVPGRRRRRGRAVRLRPWKRSVTTSCSGAFSHEPARRPLGLPGCLEPVRLHLADLS